MLEFHTAYNVDNVTEEEFKARREAAIRNLGEMFIKEVKRNAPVLIVVQESSYSDRFAGNMQQITVRELPLEIRDEH